MEIHLSRERMRHSYGSFKRSLSFQNLTATPQGSSKHMTALSINDFHIIKVLGKGSFGKVFLVRTSGPSFANVYAMKVLHKSEVVRRQQVDHTMTERYILATVKHPFILSLHCAFQVECSLE